MSLIFKKLMYQLLHFNKKNNICQMVSYRRLLLKFSMMWTFKVKLVVNVIQPIAQNVTHSFWHCIPFILHSNQKKISFTSYSTQAKTSISLLYIWFDSCIQYMFYMLKYPNLFSAPSIFYSLKKARIYEIFYFLQLKSWKVENTVFSRVLNMEKKLINKQDQPS